MNSKYAILTLITEVSQGCPDCAFSPQTCGRCSTHYAIYRDHIVYRGFKRLQIVVSNVSLM